MLLVYWECNEDEEGREAQNYVVIAPAAKEKHVDLAEYLRRYIIDGLQGIGAPPERTRYGEGLHRFFPWLWRVELVHFRGYFKENHLWTGEGRCGPQRSQMHVQRLPTPDDLRTASKGELKD